MELAPLDVMILQEMSGNGVVNGVMRLLTKLNTQALLSIFTIARVVAFVVGLGATIKATYNAQFKVV